MARLSSSVLFSLSTFPLTFGEYAVVVRAVVFTMLHNCLKTSLQNCPPLSVKMVLGAPYFVIMSSYTIWHMTFASMLNVDLMMAYLVNASIAQRMNLCPDVRAAGIGPCKSM